MTAQEALNEINNYILENGGEYSKWYVGITSDPEDRLFNSHRVNKDSPTWVYCSCVSSTAARNVESYFLEKQRTLGGQGGGDDTAIYVYAYKTNPYTVETV